MDRVCTWKIQRAFWEQILGYKALFLWEERERLVHEGRNGIADNKANRSPFCLRLWRWSGLGSDKQMPNQIDLDRSFVQCNLRSCMIPLFWWKHLLLPSSGQMIGLRHNMHHEQFDQNQICQTNWKCNLLHLRFQHAIKAKWKKNK